MQQEAEQEVERRSITWAEDVVDNEGMGKKSSKGLCSACLP
jgi:protein phosphatase 1 regulatory subunit 11